ncbi:hypothetical protein [Pacificoceanicola onchidii]|uniref:hypothetical protein n=1 Tax=Pacificoceanicola onchidii TaxID=2562685 RepID=UPI0014562404|nr:hypothetical protein [Pacificoceanicola onchidii]
MNDENIQINRIMILRRPTLPRALIAPGLQLTLIGVGIATDSAAMQWSGFVALCLMALAAAVLSRIEPMTVEEARQTLDTIEAKEALHTPRP